MWTRYFFFSCYVFISKQKREWDKLVNLWEASPRTGVARVVEGGSAKRRESPKISRCRFFSGVRVNHTIHMTMNVELTAYVSCRYRCRLRFLFHRWVNSRRLVSTTTSLTSPCLRVQVSDIFDLDVRSRATHNLFVFSTNIRPLSKEFPTMDQKNLWWYLRVKSSRCFWILIATTSCMVHAATCQSTWACAQREFRCSISLFLPHSLLFLDCACGSNRETFVFVIFTSLIAKLHISKWE